MCGIFGYVNFAQGGDIQKEVLFTMAKTIRHRGPDDSGIYIEKNVGLGHNRLSIVGVKNGRQPLSNEDKTVWVSCNGEIYNYKSLSQELIRNGHIFKTNTDTEVLVHLYEDEGIKFIDKITGMFSFALWDGNAKRLYLVRDRFGIKPLYYKEEKDCLIFGSELKSVLAHPQVNKELDVMSMRYYFSYGYIPDPTSIIKDIRKLSPASYICFSADNSFSTTYWNPRVVKNKKCNEKDIASKIFYILDNSVKEHLIGDTEIGIFLSGGIDSSIIGYLAANQHGKRIKAFSVSFDDPEYDESKYAEFAARSLNIGLHKKIISAESIIKSARSILENLDEPFADSSFIPTYILSSFAKDYVKVCLSGDGGDELFAGYPTYIAQPLADIYKKIPRFLRKNILDKMVNIFPIRNSNNKIDFASRLFIKGTDYEGIERNIIWFGPLPPHEIGSLFKKEINDFYGNSDIFAIAKEYLRNFDYCSRLEKELIIDRKFFLTGDILFKTDCASMANSLEVRVPYLDYRIAEFVNTLPAHLKLRAFTNKYILKKAFQNRLHRKILFRKKRGFNVGIGKLLKEGLLDEFADLFREDVIKRQGIFEYGYIKNMISDHMRSRDDNRRPIWSLIAFQVWFNKYLGLP